MLILHSYTASTITFVTNDNGDVENAEENKINRLRPVVGESTAI